MTEEFVTVASSELPRRKSRHPLVIAIATVAIVVALMLSLEFRCFNNQGLLVCGFGLSWIPVATIPGVQQR